MPVVLVSGCNGFIAKHIVKQLIAENYTVVGTVRKDESGKDMLVKFPKNFSYEIVESVTAPEAFGAVFQKHPEIEYFLHTASPVAMVANDFKNDIIIPAIQGTEQALISAKKYAKNLKHFVLTSSICSIVEPYDYTTKCTEKTWNTLNIENGQKDGFVAYSASKTLAEKALWDFLAKEKPHFTANALLPPYVFGPQAFDEDARGTLNFTGEIVVGLTRLKKGDPVPEFQGHWADVRNIAQAHILALQPKTYGKRVVPICRGTYSSQRILNIINDNFKELDLPVGNPQQPLVKEFIDTTATRELLQINFIPLEKTVVDAVSQYLKTNKSS